VLVKISYFPNWHASGAEGPWRIAPNLMVVIPTSNNVHLTYERSGLDYGAYVLTFLGIAFLILLRIRGDVRHANAHPFGQVFEPAGFEWEEWEADPDAIVDPTPTEAWEADDEIDDDVVDLDAPLSDESVIWAPPDAAVPADTRPPDGSL
jgi:hypothetical protein